MFGQIQRARELQLCIAENHYELPFWDTLEHKSKVSQKPRCSDFSQVTVLKELVDGTLERDFTKATFTSVWSWIYIKKVRQGVFKYFLLKCTTNRDVLKRICLTGAFIQHFTHFKALFRWGSVKLHFQSFILIETCYSHRKWQIYRPSEVFSKIAKKSLLTLAVFITLLIKIYMIFLPMEVCC